MAYSDFPMPADYPDFPHHIEVSRYFEAYAEHFRLKDRITFNATVARARRDAEGWSVALANGDTRRYRVLVVANGHHWDPRWPAIPGRFDGEILHSHGYIDPHEPVAMTAKRVVVVGLGNSAMDIAAELSRPGGAARVYLSARRGAWILPKYFFGVPLDRLSVTHPLVPWRIQSRLTRLMLWIARAPPPWRYGLPRPDHPPLAAHPTISQDVPGCLARGEIIAKPAISSLESDRVHFADGSSVEADVIVYCTGYKVRFPFFDRDFLGVEDNDLPLWRRIARPGEDDLFFVGLLQPLGAIMPLAEAQAELVGDCIAGAYALPPREVMQAEMERERRALARRFVRSERHTMEVDFDRYLHDLRREHRAGLRRRRS